MIGICHHTVSATNPVVFIEVSENAIKAHKARSDEIGVDLQADENNCGACGNVCASEQSCVRGECTCRRGTVECAGSCVPPCSSGQPPDPVNCTCGDAGEDHCRLTGPGVCGCVRPGQGQCDPRVSCQAIGHPGGGVTCPTPGAMPMMLGLRWPIEVACARYPAQSFVNRGGALRRPLARAGCPLRERLAS
jgi:hypothetical protein